MDQRMNILFQPARLDDTSHNRRCKRIHSSPAIEYAAGNDPLHNGRVSLHPAKAQARCKDLRKRTQRNDMFRIDICAKGFGRHLGITKKLIDFIRKDQKITILRKGYKSIATFLAEGVTAGVLKRRNDIDKFRAMILQGSFQVLDNNARFIGRNLNDAQAMDCEELSS